MQKKRSPRRTKPKKPKWVRWSKKEKLALLTDTSEASISTVLRHAQRSESAVRAKAYREWGCSSLTRGTFSLAEVVRTTGYNWRQLRRAQLALRQRWGRLRKRGRYMISDEQIAELLQWLQTDYWAKVTRSYACGWCGTTDQAHQALGLCRRCYHRYRVAARSVGLWRLTHPELIDLVKQLAPEGDPLRRALVDLQRGAALRRPHLIELAARRAAKTVLL